MGLKPEKEEQELAAGLGVSKGASRVETEVDMTADLPDAPAEVSNPPAVPTTTTTTTTTPAITPTPPLPPPPTTITKQPPPPPAVAPAAAEEGEAVEPEEAILARQVALEQAKEQAKAAAKK